MRRHVLQVRQLQAEKLTELGVRLCEGRKLLGMSLDEVASKTHIQQRLLRAIETGNLDDLPEPVYIQSFIRQYANAIGLNGVHL
ncbi:MAG: helix-turn-helix domain-containing protein, partial [Synechococcales bacterium]|nr:helix-turn-helix domain-containing protein [Synechococcales bacterium]